MHYQDDYKIPAVSRDAAEGRMKEINEAYAALSDPEKFAAYDRIGQGYKSYMAGVRVNLAK
ncbi:MAG: hypothetical protein WAT12_13665 [Candidatus Nitrotoga sp.]